MKTNLTVDQLEKIKPPYFIKPVDKMGDLYLTFDEIGWDEEKENLYTKPVLQLRPTFRLPSNIDVSKRENLFYWYPRIKKPSDRWDWYFLGKTEDSDKIKVYKGSEYLKGLIKAIFKDYA